MKIICRKSLKRGGPATSNQTKSTIASVSQSGVRTNQKSLSGHMITKEMMSQEVPKGETSGGGLGRQDGHI